MNFRIILSQFYINFSRQEHQIDVLYVSFNAWDSQVPFYTSFHFSWGMFFFPLLLVKGNVRSNKMSSKVNLIFVQWFSTFSWSSFIFPVSSDPFMVQTCAWWPFRTNRKYNGGINFIHISYIYSTTKHEILQISNQNLLRSSSLDPPNQGWLFWVFWVYSMSFSLNYKTVKQKYNF